MLRISRRLDLGKYAVRIRGENFLIQTDGAQEVCGFFTTRFVEAPDWVEAELQAMALIRNELKGLVLNDREDSPMMYLEQIDKVDSFRGVRPPGAGFTWFSGDGE